MVDGLIQNWLLDTSAFDLERTGMRAIDTYLEGLGLAVPACTDQASPA